MGIAYTLKQFYYRKVYIVVGMYETAFDQKYICNATSFVILSYPLQYINISELDCYQIKIINIYVPFIYSCFMYIPRCALRDKVMPRLSVNCQVFTETYLPFDYDTVFLLLLTFSRNDSRQAVKWKDDANIFRNDATYIYIT